MSSALDAALDEAARPLRGMSGLAWMSIAAAAAVAMLALAAWLLRLGIVDAPAWVMVVWLVLGAVLVAGLAAARRAIRALGPWHVARRLEAEGAWRRGALTTVLDGSAPGTSGALHDDARHRCATAVADRGSAALEPLLDVQLHRARRALLAAVAAGVLLVAARPLSGAPARLWSPGHAWDALTGGVHLAARTPSVARGEPAVLEVRAVGRQQVMLFTRSPGEAWKSVPVELDGDGKAVVTTAPLSADLVARVESGGRRSDEVRVAIRLPAFLGALTATAEYPAYLSLEPEAMSVTGDTLVLPEGTRLVITGRATTPLRTAGMRSEADAIAFDVDGAVFRGVMVPRRSSTWRMQITQQNGAALDGEMPHLPVRIIADSAPVVEIPVPGVDTVAPPSMTVPVMVSAQDDHGLASAMIEVRVGASGRVTRLPLPLGGTEGDRALLSASLDLAVLGARPGDTVFYAGVATDNAPMRHAGRSREYAIRVPTDDEQRLARTAATADASSALDSLAVQARRAQRQTEDLARERQRADAASGGADAQPMTLDAARKAEAAARAQEKLLDDAEQARKAVDDLQRAAERDGLADSSLARQLGEIRELLDKAITPEMRAKLEELRQATKALDADQTRNALQDVAKQQAELRDALEQARELLKRAALETDLATMSEEARNLAKKQSEVTDKLVRPDSSASAVRQQEELARLADSLSSSLERAAQKVPSEQTQQGLKQAAQKASKAGEQMRKAAQAGKEGKTGEAQEAGEQAEEQLDALDEQIDEEREEMQREMKEEVIRALDRALAETSRLAERQNAVANAFRRGALVTQSRSEQGLIEEGAAKILQQVVEVAAKNALVSPQVAAALSAARISMRLAIGSVSTSSPNLRDASDQAGDAVDALAVAAFQLLRSKDDVGGSKSGSGVEEAMQKMKEMAGKQGQMSQQAQGMLQQGQGGMQQLMQLAMQQRAMAQQMERMRAGGQIPGAGEMAREAKELARAIEAGRLSQETVQRQEKLFRRMLDAGRTLEGEERDDTKERKSEAPRALTPGVPPGIDAALLRGDAVRLPGWDELQRLSVEDRRRVLDYFRRLAEVGTR